MKLILPVEIADEIEPHLSENNTIVRVDGEGNIDGDATDAEVYFSWFYLKPTTLHRVLDAARLLHWHHAPNAGVNHILTPKYLERDLILTNGSGVHGIPIAEFVIAYLLAYSKRLPSLYKLQNEHDWQRGLPIREQKKLIFLNMSLK